MAKVVLFVALVAVLAATADAFCASPNHCILAGQGFKGASALRATRPVVARKTAVALRMQSEDDKAKAAGIAAGVLGLIVSKFSLLVAVLAGGAAVYTAKLPEEGDKGLSDTAKQVSLLVGEYSLKAFDFVKEKDAAEGFSKQFTDKIKSSVDSAKAQIEK